MAGNLVGHLPVPVGLYPDNPLMSLSCQNGKNEGSSAVNVQSGREKMYGCVSIVK